MIHYLLVERLMKKASVKFLVECCGLTKKEAEADNPWDTFKDTGGFEGSFYKYMLENNMLVVIDDEKDIKLQIRESKSTLNEVLEALLDERKELLDVLNEKEEEMKDLVPLCYFDDADDEF